MQPTDSLDTLSNSNGQADSFLWVVLVALIGLGLLIWYLFRDKSSSKISTNTSRQRVTQTTSDPLIKTKSEVTKNKDFENNLKTLTPPIKEPDILPETSKPKHIGYIPINIFEQTEPLNFPYVIMPKENCVIKFPQKGTRGRKGVKEDDFKIYLTKYFSNTFQLFNDRFVLVKGNNKSFEPDFTLIDEKHGINIFVDIEIDEPYEGINDIANRKATHYRFADTNRNNAFKNRGWIVIRFAEIQIHQNPNSCCLFIADVLANIYPQFKIPNELTSAKQIIPIPQWTKEEAEQMSRDKFREKYLNIEKFGNVEVTEKQNIYETDLGAKTEEIVKDEPPLVIPTILQSEHKTITKQDILITALKNNQYISFTYNGSKTIVKPINFNNGLLNAYCYIKNGVKNFTVTNIINPIIKQRPFTLAATGPNLGLDRIKTVVNTAIQYNKFIQMRYTRGAFVNYDIDTETGEVIIKDKIEAEESLRTISNIQLAINNLDRQELRGFTPNENYITAYCHRREAERMFRFDRISEVAILDL